VPHAQTISRKHSLRHPPAAAAYIAGSQLLINEFMKQMAYNAVGGYVGGRLVGLGLEALNTARAARAAAAAIVEASAEADATLIANGHAFLKHAGEFGSVSQAGFKELVKDTISHPSDFKYLSNGRSAFWSESNQMVVIRNPGAVDGGTAFSPTAGKAYFNGLH
jgi:filamentous hemagglutinin